MEVSRHWRLQGQRYNLIGDVCPHCSKKMFHKRAVCPYCAGEAKVVAPVEVEVEKAAPVYPLMVVAEATPQPVFVRAA